MKTISVVAILIMVALCGYSDAGEAAKVFRRANGSGELDLKGAPAHVQKLVETTHATDMNQILLSENKGVRWLVWELHILSENLVSLHLQDGNGAEDVLFGRDDNKKWSIIRRVPGGDWKPEEARKGDRLTVIPFPPKAQKAEQDAAE